MNRLLTRTMCGLMLVATMIFAGTPIFATTLTSAPRAALQRNFIVPDNMLIDATLNTRLNAGNVRDGRRFTMTVTSPNEYRSARIEGFVSQVQRSGRVRGRSEMTLNFDRIRLRNGQTYNFAGTVENARTAGGGQIDVDREGSVQEDSQTDRTVGRSVLGGAAGAVIGAIAGGGSGAATGAIVGGGLGAGSVLAQGRRNLDLRAGTRLTIRASAPR